jgi:hypothetical protein
MRWKPSVAILISLSGPAAAQDPPRLFSEIFSASQPVPPRALAAFPVDVDLSALAMAPQNLLLELPALGEWVATRTDFALRPGGFDWTGKTALHDVILSVDGDLVTGFIRGGSVTFSLISRRSGSGANYSLQRMNPFAFPPDVDDPDPGIGAKASATPDNPDRACFGEPSDSIDLVIVYSPEVLAAAGDDPEVVENALHTAITAANATLDNSEVRASLRLLHAELAPASLVEERDKDDLVHARENPELIQLRRNWKADVLTYMTSGGVRDDGIEYCGVTRTMRRAGTYGYGYAFAPNAVNVVTWPCGVQNNDLSHEVGHNVGLDHNQDGGFSASTPQQNLYPFAFGHQVNGLFRDDMSGENATNCPDHCPREMFFSSPAQTFLGVPRGIAGARDNAETYRRMSRCVSTFAEYVFIDGYE